MTNKQPKTTAEKQREKVGTDTYRLQLDDGSFLYRVDGQVVHVLCFTISQSLYDISQNLGEIHELLKDTMADVNPSGSKFVPAMRILNYGD